VRPTAGLATSGTVAVNVPGRSSIRITSPLPNKTARSETRFQYRPRNDRLLGVAYRYQDGLLEQGDISLVWPIGQAWRVIARTSYSFLDGKSLENPIL